MSTQSWSKRTLGESGASSGGGSSVFCGAATRDSKEGERGTTCDMAGLRRGAHPPSLLVCSGTEREAGLVTRPSRLPNLAKPCPKITRDRVPPAPLPRPRHSHPRLRHSALHQCCRSAWPCSRRSYCARMQHILQRTGGRTLPSASLGSSLDSGRRDPDRASPVSTFTRRPTSCPARATCNTNNVHSPTPASGAHRSTLRLRKCTGSCRARPAGGTPARPGW